MKLSMDERLLQLLLAGWRGRSAKRFLLGGMTINKFPQLSTLVIFDLIQHCVIQHCVSEVVPIGLNRAPLFDLFGLATGATFNYSAFGRDNARLAALLLASGAFILLPLLDAALGVGLAGR